MARTSISFNNTSLQTANLVTSSVNHVTYDNRNLNLEAMANRDGSKLVFERRGPKTIVVQGHMKYDTQAEFEAAIDNLKNALNKQQANLDIDFNGTTRRYVATVESVEIPIEHYNINFAPFKITFVVPNGYGESISSSSDSTTSAVTEVSRDLVIAGTLAPKPTFTINVKSETHLNRFVVQNVTTGRSMTIETDYASNDELIINLDTNEVTLNGINQNYSGVFPEFTLGFNEYTITPNATAVDFDSVLSYTARYL